MIRWALFVIGLGCLVMAAVTHFGRAAVNEVAKPMTAAEAGAWVNSDSGRRLFVELTADYDADTKLYHTPSGISEPGFTRKNPDDVYAVLGDSQPAFEDLADYLGTVVRVKGDLGPDYLSLQLVVDGDKDDVSKERVVAPVAGTGGKIWALSKAFSESSYATGWLAESRITGVLTRLSDLKENMPTPEMDIDAGDVFKELESALSVSPTDDAYLIICDYEMPEDSLYHCPFKNAEQTLFVAMRPSSVASVPNPVTGMLTVWTDGMYREFGPLTGVELTPAIATLRQGGTGREFNEETRRLVMSFVIGGGLGVLLGGSVILIKRSGRKRRIAAYEASKAAE